MISLLFLLGILAIVIVKNKRIYVVIVKTIDGNKQNDKTKPTTGGMRNYENILES